MGKQSLFRESIAWQRAMDLTIAVYAATKRFPKEELFGLSDQLRRAAVSVASNSAEGKGRLTQSELTHFLGIARGSVLEVQTQLELAERLQLGDPQDVRVAQSLSVEVLRLLNASLRTLRAAKRFVHILSTPPLFPVYCLLSGSKNATLESA